MTLNQGIKGNHYRICSSCLPFELERRLEALGMTSNAEIQILHKKRNGTAVILLRGSRFAFGKDITSQINVESVSESERICDQ